MLALSLVKHLFCLVLSLPLSSRLQQTFTTDTGILDVPCSGKIIVICLLSTCAEYARDRPSSGDEPRADSSPSCPSSIIVESHRYSICLSDVRILTGARSWYGST